MATFQAQVEDLTSLSVSDTDELSQFLRDGVMDVTNRCLVARPQELQDFQRESSEITSQAGIDINGAQIISVVRESGTNNDWRNCRQISPALQSRVVDSDSLHFASQYNPAYMVGDDSKISVFPTPGSNPDVYKIYYVNNSPVDKSGAALIYSHSDIGYFSDDKVYLVVLYAGMKVLQAKMGDSIISISVTVPVAPSLTSVSFTATNDLNTTAIVPTTPSSPSFTYTDASVSDLVKPLVSISDMAALTESAPTYTAPVVSLTSFPSLSWTMPAVPILPTINAESSSTGGAEVDTSKLATAPSYTPPVMNAPDFSDANTWITTEEDSEMLASRVQMIQAQIGEYQAKLAESQAKFSEENAEYQAKLQIAMQDASQANTGDSAKIQKFSGQVGIYSAEITSIIQSNQGEITAWQQENALVLQKYAPDIQNALNDFNEANVLYQQDIQRKRENFQKDIQEAIKNIDNEMQINGANLNKNTQIALQNALQDFQQDVQEYGSSLQKYSHELNAYQQTIGKNIQEYSVQLQADVQDMQAIIADNQVLIGRYQAELQSYQSEVVKETQEQSAKMQQYQLLYNQIKADYDGAYAIMAPKQQAAQRAA